MLGMVLRPMSSEPRRRTRVTLRCLREDLDVEIPPIEIDLGSLDHPLLAEARRVAPAAPRGRSASSRSSVHSVTRLRHGRGAGATWLESEAAQGWLRRRAARGGLRRGCL